MIRCIKSVEEFEKILATAADKLVVVDFYATWCGPCKEMEPHLRKLVAEYKDRATVIKVNVDKFNDICDYYKVRSMPTFLFIKNHKRISSFAGADPKLLAQRMATLTK